ncbi:hypothetical protein HK104_008244 [Borealophlyctis nickersoniae]|nr:hypothetical protein HK104_008244 [Borealophlyctis nickersoniae]
MEQTVKSTARDLKADVLTLDYATILDAARTIANKSDGGLEGSKGSKPGIKGKIERRMERPDTLKITSPFSPSSYAPYVPDQNSSDDVHPHSRGLRDEEEFDEEDDEEFSEDEEEYSDEEEGRYGSRPHSLARPQKGFDWVDRVRALRRWEDLRGRYITPRDLTLNVKLSQTVEGGSRPISEGGGSGHQSAPPIRVEQVSLGDDNSGGSSESPTHMPHWYIHGSHYEQQIPAPLLRDTMKALLDFVVCTCQEIPKSILPHLRRSRRMIVFVKDITDILEVGTEGGKRTILGLLDVINEARIKHRLPIALVAGCSPSLLNPENVGRSMDFYRQMFDGAVTFHTDRNPVSDLWEAGRLFRTILDDMTNDFEKIEMLPPAPALVLRNESAGDVDPAKTEAVYRNFGLWLESMQKDEKARLRDVNRSSIEAACVERGIVVRGLDAATMTREAVDRNLAPDSLQPLLDQMETEIWSRQRVDRLISFALGCRLDVPAGAGAATTQTEEAGSLDLTVRHFADGMAVMEDNEAYRTIQIGNIGNKIVPADGGGGTDESSGGDGVNAEANGVQSAEGDAESSLPDQQTQQQIHLEHQRLHPLQRPTLQDQEDGNSPAVLLKQMGYRPNAHEKKLLSTVVNPSELIDLAVRWLGTAQVFLFILSGAIKVGFEDLILPPSTKLLLQTLVSLPLLRPDHFAHGILARHSINGVLLFGPPGTGKTMLAKAVAKSSGARFMNVALSNVFDKYVGEGEKNVKAVFTLARKLSPCVVFLDEVDALFGSRRGDGSNPSRREIINEFMSEWDGLTSNNSGIILMGATNRPFDLDDAILRRMPRRLLVDLPNETQRAKILAVHLREERLDPSVDIAALAKKTPLYSGSDLKNLCVAAALARVKQAVLKEALAAKPGPDGNVAEVTDEEVLKRMEEIEDWSAIVGKVKAPERAGRARRLSTSTVKTSPPSTSTVTAGGTSLGPLTAAHFDVGLKEVPPSLTDEMQTLVELRKWDEMYGDGAARRKGKAKRGWGFDVRDTEVPADGMKEDGKAREVKVDRPEQSGPVVGIGAAGSTVGF